MRQESKGPPSFMGIDLLRWGLVGSVALVIAAFKFDGILKSLTGTGGAWFVLLAVPWIFWELMQERRKKLRTAQLKTEADRLRVVINALEGRVVSAHDASQMAVEEYLLLDTRSKLKDVENQLEGRPARANDHADWVKIALAVAVLGLGFALYKVAEYAAPFSDLRFSPSYNAECDPNDCTGITLPRGRKCFSTYSIKGYSNTYGRRVYVTFDDPYYAQVDPDWCFSRPVDAESQGYRPLTR